MVLFEYFKKVPINIGNGKTYIRKTVTVNVCVSETCGALILGVWKYVLLQVRMFKHGPSFKSRNPQLGNRDRFENLNSQTLK